MIPATASLHPTEELTSDERWAAWIAKGREQDRMTRKRERALLVLIVLGAALWLAIVLLQQA